MNKEEVYAIISSMSEEDIEWIRDGCDGLLDSLEIEKDSES